MNQRDNLLDNLVGRRIANDTTAIPTIPMIPATAIKLITIVNHECRAWLNNEVLTGTLDDISPLTGVICLVPELLDIIKFILLECDILVSFVSSALLFDYFSNLKIEKARGAFA